MPSSELEASTSALGVPCPDCGLLLAPALLVCPQCQALVHRQQLQEFAAQAEQARARGDLAEAMASWRKALPLLPTESKQHAQLLKNIRELRERVDAGEPAGRLASPAVPQGAGPSPAPAAPKTGWERARGLVVSVGALLLFKLKSVWVLLLGGWKPLLLGFTKLGTLSSMLLSLGVYWQVFGWYFALGLVLCIYVHEIGHVVALKRLGIAATSPMFIPGVGAIVRLKQYPIDATEDAQVGLAGPRWGLGVSAVAWAVGFFAEVPLLLAIAKTSAWLNLFNLIPVPPLDGGHGFRALSNRERLIVAVGLGAVYGLTHQGMLGIVALVALFRSFEQRAEPAGNRRVLIEYLLVAALLGVLAMEAASATAAQ
jgi:Zn-dependent protease